MRLSARRLAALAAALLACAACGRPSGAFPKAPVVLLCVDTLRADHLPFYGYSGVETPNLTALRKDSILFQNAYSHVPLTLPSHATLFTGLLPYQHGVRDNIGFRLTGEHATLAQLLSAKGYAAGAAVSTYLLRSGRGLEAGFDFYDDHFSTASADERAGAETARRLEAWMDTVSGRPVFAFLHLYEPHAPYVPPEPFASRYAAHPYDGEIAAADAALGGFLGYLRRRNLYDRSLVVFLSDHGEGLNDHGEEEHGVFLYREAIRVPVLIKLPHSRRAGESIAWPVGLADILPTVAEAVGLGVPREIAGRSAFSGDPRRRIYAETLYPRFHFGWSDLASLTDDRYQYIGAPKPELYDLASDPSEKNNLAAQMPAPFRSMRTELEGLVRPLQAPAPTSSEEAARLASLGYISARSSTAPEVLPDPKDRVETLRKFKRMFALFHAGKDAEAAAQAREIVAEDPENLSAWRTMSESLARMGRVPEAAQELREGLAKAGSQGLAEEITQAYAQLADLLAREGDSAGRGKVLREAAERNLASEAMKRELGRLLTESGRAPEAVALLAPFQENGEAETLDVLGVACAEAGRLEQARAALERALASDPTRFDFLLHRGALALRQGDAASAREWFERALREKPESAEALSSLGIALARLGDQEGARGAWKKAVALDATQYEALFNLSVMEGRLGNTREARHGLQLFLAKAPRDRFRQERTEAQKLLVASGGAPK
jgi:arylsulfatase A-like enzyme/Flp pilus assembly protein TadD